MPKSLRSVESPWGGWWDMQLGAIKGSLDYLGIESDIPSLAGGLGYAFIINITNDNCPSGPYFTVSSATDELSRLDENLGYHAEIVISRYDKSDAAQRRKEARELTLRVSYFSLENGFVVECTRRAPRHRD